MPTAYPYGRVGTKNSKMPGTVYSITAHACRTGSKLSQIEGTPCHGCYALRLESFRPSVHAAYQANLAAWQAAELAGNTGAWSRNIAEQIVSSGAAYHRWFDFGDLQSVAMLLAIVNVCELTPNVKHWLPTQERAMVADYVALFGALPKNLLVRVSASKIDGALPNADHASVVVTKDKKTKAYKVPSGATLCEAKTRGNKCGPCRACWNNDVPAIAYPKH